MNCESVREHLTAWCDRQLEPHEMATVDAHLAKCSDCHAASEALLEQDALLRRAFRPQRATAERLSARVIDNLILPAGKNVTHGAYVAAGSDSANAAAAGAQTKRLALNYLLPWRGAQQLVSLLLATAAGFLLAAVVFQPWNRPTQVSQPIASGLKQLSVAELVVATGLVEVRQPGDDQWRAVSNLAALACPSGSDVRTGPEVRCELKQSSGGTIRLNGETQVSLDSADTVSIERGQIWCSSPERTPIEVLVIGGVSPTVADDACVTSCAPASSMFTCVEAGRGLHVSTASGEIDVQTQSSRTRLKSGESASIVHGAITKADASTDSLASASWMRSLWLRKDAGSPEVARYVLDLLSQMDNPQHTQKCEQDIRSLGEYAVAPLIHFVQEAQPPDSHERRQFALRILSDIATTRAIGDLIGLLSSADAEVRFTSAKTLQRLTGLDQGRQADQWRESLDACRPSIAMWREWWAGNQRQFPPPLVETGSQLKI